MDKPAYIYLTIDKENLEAGICPMFYVGSTVAPVGEGYIGSGKLLKAAISARGKDAFERIDLEQCLASNRFELETECLEKTNASSSDLFYNINCAPGGDFVRSKEFIAQMSIRMSGDLNPAKRPEVRAKLAAAARGRSLSPEHRAKLSAATKGRPSPLKGRRLSEDHRAKLSAIRTGRKNHPEATAKTAAAHRGMKRSEATCSRIGDAKRGVALSSEHKSKLKIASSKYRGGRCIVAASVDGSVGYVLFGTGDCRAFQFDPEKVRNCARSKTRGGRIHSGFAFYSHKRETLRE